MEHGHRNKFFSIEDGDVPYVNVCQKVQHRKTLEFPGFIRSISHTLHGAGIFAYTKAELF